MRKSRITEDQIIRILREADTKSVPKVAKRHGVREQTIYTWHIVPSIPPSPERPITRPIAASPPP